MDFLIIDPTTVILSVAVILLSAAGAMANPFFRSVGPDTPPDAPGETEDGGENAQSTHELYEEALASHSEASCNNIISDNAQYYHNKELKEWMKITRIKLFFFRHIPKSQVDRNFVEIFL